jgi:hypothetical protein
VQGVILEGQLVQILEGDNATHAFHGAVDVGRAGTCIRGGGG